MEKLQFNNEQVLKILELRLKTWENKKQQSDKVDACLIASIVDAKEDIKTIKRAIRITKNFEKMFN